MATKLSPEDSIALIKANLAEVLNPELIDHVILKEKRPLKVYWGTATTGRPHCGYFVPMMKIAELLAAGCHVKILLADIHGYLDNMKAPIDLVEFRAKYYEHVIKGILKAVGVDLSRLEFVLGSSYQLNKDYTMDRFKLEGITRVNVAQKAGAEVVKQTDDPTLGGLIYPLMQALDEQYLGVDAQFGGVDQRKIFTFAMENLPKIGYGVRAHLMNSMVPGLGEAVKMSASDPDSKIDVLDGPSVVEKKLKKAVCKPKEVEGNGVIAFVEHVIFRAIALNVDREPFTVQRRDQEPLVYESIQKLKEDYAADILTPQLLKSALVHHLNELLKPIITEYEASPEWQAIALQAYPPPKVEAKVKKVKDKGDPALRAAAAAARKAGVVAKPDGHVEGPGAEKATVGPSTEETLQKLKVSE
ncbi:tyrosine tRNA ligase [Hyaloscypha variabilis F]|uniref:Tyrosine--tRNA ligase n=1 Tax=Hyaloscypha variabilis (strain UAMH 11265 / GT02V1 / F) TaxID=1149755 RepID=A0A2J6QYD6_HYAVF|nr:tyrosine tRNA ligase [Hyaloscypha variabilis F]